MKRKKELLLKKPMFLKCMICIALLLAASVSGPMAVTSRTVYAAEEEETSTTVFWEEDEQDQHQLVILDMEGGTVTADAETVQPGTAVTLTIVPDEGYEYVPGSLKITDVDPDTKEETPIPESAIRTIEENAQYAFEIAASCVIYIRASFTETASSASEYAIKVDRDLDWGSLSVDVDSAPAGQLVTVTAHPDAGYECYSVFLINSEGALLNDSKPQAMEKNVYTFTMPAQDVEVSGSFRIPTYSISLDVKKENVPEGQNITCQVDAPENAEAGEKVSLSVTLQEEVELVSLEVTGDESGTTIAADAVRHEEGSCVYQYDFTMPEEPVTVAAVVKLNRKMTWADLREAINNSKAGDVIVLENDIVAGPSDTAIVIATGKSLTIDLNGYTLDRNLKEPQKDGYLFQIKLDSKLIINDSSDGQGRITGGNNTENGGAFNVIGRLIINGGLVTGNKARNGGGVYASAEYWNTGNGRLDMYGGAITGNEALENGGGYCGSGFYSEINLNGGEIRENKAGAAGGGIYGSSTVNSLGKVSVLEGAKIVSNTANDGGGIYADGKIDLSVNGEISNNTALRNGGGFCAASSLSKYNLQGAVLSGNKAVNGAGAYLGEGIKITFKECSFLDNTASENGGGLYVSSNGFYWKEQKNADPVKTKDTSYVATIQNCTFRHNIARKAGGGIWLDGDVKMTENTLEENEAPDGPGIYSTSMPTTWAGLQEALDNAANGMTIVLGMDLTAEASDAVIKTPYEKEITLDLNGHTLDRALKAAKDNGYVIYVDYKSKLTIIDGSNGQGKITGGNNTGKGGGIYAEGYLALKGGVITGNKAKLGGGVYVTSLYSQSTYGHLDMYGGVISGNEATENGGGICGTGEYYEIMVLGGEIRENKAAGNGGAIFGSNAGVSSLGLISVHEEVKIDSNTAKNGGGIYADEQCRLFCDGQITNNTATVNGGGLYVGRWNGAPTSSNAVFEGNKAVKGGGVYLGDDIKIVFNGCTFRGNTASEQGAGLYISSNGYYWKVTSEGDTHTKNAEYITTVKNCTFSGNTSQNTGGGMYLAGKAVLTDTAFEENVAQEGAGVCASAEMNADHCTFTGNNASKYGGGIQVRKEGYVKLTDCTLSENLSGKHGGGIAISAEGKLGAENSTFNKNKAEEHGGFLWMNGDSDKTYASFEFCKFTGNTAGYGAGFHSEGKGTLVLKSSKIYENFSYGRGGAIYAKNSGLRLVLIESDVVKNKANAEGGGILAEGTVISLQGVVNIIDNLSTVENSYYHNLCFANGAYIGNPDLENGSHIKITTASKTFFAKDMSKYQLRYFKADRGRISFTEEKAYNTPLFASLFNNGSWIVILALLAAGAAVTAFLILRKKSTRKETEDENEET